MPISIAASRSSSWLRRTATSVGETSSRGPRSEGRPSVRPGLIVFLVLLFGLGPVLGFRAFPALLVAVGASGLVDLPTRRRSGSVGRRIRGGLLVVTDRRLLLMGRDGGVVDELPLAELMRIDSTKSGTFGTVRAVIESAEGTEVLRLAGDYPKRTARRAIDELETLLHRRAEAPPPSRSLLRDRPSSEALALGRSGERPRIGRGLVTYLVIGALGVAVGFGTRGHGTGASAGPSAYPNSARTAYMRECARRGASSGKCACQFDFLRRYISYGHYRSNGGPRYFSDLVNLSTEAVLVTTGKVDQITNAVTACIGEG